MPRVLGGVPPRKIPVKRPMVRMGAGEMRHDEREDQTPCDLVEGRIKAIEHRGTIIGMLLFVLGEKAPDFDFGRMKREARSTCEREEQGNRGADNCWGQM